MTDTSDGEETRSAYGQGGPTTSAKSLATRRLTSEEGNKANSVHIRRYIADINGIPTKEGEGPTSERRYPF